MNNLLKYVSIILGMVLISNQTFAAGNEITNTGISNNSLFYLLLVVGGVILLAILYMSRAIGGLVKSDIFKEKVAIKKNDDTTNNASGNSGKVLAVLLLIAPMISFSQGSEIAQVSDSFDKQSIWMMLSIDVILLFVLLYLKRVFNQLLNVVVPAKVREKKRVGAAFNKVLTDAIPIEREAEIMTDHEYDGIKELDNNLPPWWIWSFYASIVFAVVYMFNYHVFETGDLQLAEYEKAGIKQDEQVAEYLKSMKLNVDENSVTLLTDASDISAGKGIFDNKCIACHGKAGEGVIGPNLTDDYWVKGGDVKSIFTTIKYGTNKGMQAWKDELNPIEMQQVTSFIKSIRGTVEGGKEPQGELYVEGGEAAAPTDSVTSSVDTIIVQDVTALNE